MYRRLCLGWRVRIYEIERSLQELPSIAVLVNDEDQVGPIAAGLGDALTDQNIRVIPCHNGQVRGRDDAHPRVQCPAY